MKVKYLLLGLLFSIILTGVMAIPLEGKTEAEEKKEKMLMDTFSFFRGDIASCYDYVLSHSPRIKEHVPEVHLHGDSHIENFGIWWTEEEGLKFGLIDFEETAKGPFYLDLERFGIGLVLASREKGVNEEKKIIRTVFRNYLKQLEEFKDYPEKVAEDLNLRHTSLLVKRVWERGEKNSRPDMLNGYGKTSLNEKGERCFNADLDFVPVEPAGAGMDAALKNYLESLSPEHRKKGEFYRIKDAVQVKRCGLGSLGNIKYRLLIEGPSPSQDDDYILELREVKSLRAGARAGRICQAQKKLQGLSSPFLGYTRFEDKDFLVDEVYPWYSTVMVKDLKTLKDFLDLAEVGGKILAQAHCRSASPEDILGLNILDEIENTILDYSYISELKTLSCRLHEARNRWMDSLEDRNSEKALENAYKDMQAYCRNFLKKNNSFRIEEMEKIAQEVRYPYEVYYNDLYIEANRLKEQLFNITTPGTIANSYYERPTEKNLQNLKTLFDRIYQYYIGKSYSWNRYLNKYLFQKSRLEHYFKEWNYWDEQYQLSGSPYNREMAEFCYERLKKECQTNNLPQAGEVNAFYISQNFDGYYDELLREEKLKKIRREKGSGKEVVVLVHGLGEDRSSWKALPELLAYEDTVDLDLKKHFKVYLFRFDTIEDSKSVSNFVRELSGFIREVQEREGAEKVNVIAHSLGGVLTLKYLAKNTDPDFDLRPSADAHRPIVSASEVLDGFLADKYRNNIKRFIGLAPSFSGSKVANAVIQMFKKPEAWFEETVKALDTGDVPSKGDIQVEENQIGSSVNLDSFMRLDLERPLDPLNLLTMPGIDRRLSDPQKERLDEKEVKVLTIIGIPPRTISRSEEYRGRKEFGISEDDGLVRVYSANLNHNYFKDNEARENIGYQKAEVRYLPMGHFELAAISSRNHPAYKYIVSFLNERLLPHHEDEKDFSIKTFGIVLRVTPPDSLEVELAKDSPEFSSGIVMQERLWNDKTGAYFEQGTFTDNNLKEGRVVYLLKASGYKARTISIPVTRGQLTYAPHLTMEKE